MAWDNGEIDVRPTSIIARPLLIDVKPPWDDAMPR
jgi:hypothetical protein